MNTSPDMPSSRPTTLRQQLVACFYDELMSEPSENDIELFDTQAVIDKLEILCQEIAREAALTELNYVRGFGERGGHDVYCRTIGEAVLERIAELTHKPQGDSRE